MNNYPCDGPDSYCPFDAVGGMDCRNYCGLGVDDDEEETMEMEKEFFVPVTHSIKVTQEDIDDIMCSALEGGITYWCNRAEVVGDYLGEYASEQIARGGMLKLYDAEEDEVYELTLAMFLKGIQLAIQHNYYADYDWHDGHILDTCNVDAAVADVIIQLALFDDVIYG